MCVWKLVLGRAYNNPCTGGSIGMVAGDAVCLSPTVQLASAEIRAAASRAAVDRCLLRRFGLLKCETDLIDLKIHRLNWKLSCARRALENPQPALFGEMKLQQEAKFDGLESE